MEKLPECILFMLFYGKIDCTFKTIVKVCGCCDKLYTWKQRKVVQTLPIVMNQRKKNRNLLLPFIYIFPYVFTNQTAAVFLAEPVADTIAGITTFTFFFRTYHKQLLKKTIDKFTSIS